MSERKLQIEIRLALGMIPGVVFWRNSNAGVESWDERTGEVRYHHAGLPKGSGDLVGIVDGRFVSLEIKTSSGRERPEQIAWGNVVRAHGGYHAVVRSVDDALAAVECARQKQ